MEPNPQTNPSAPPAKSQLQSTRRTLLSHPARQSETRTSVTGLHAPPLAGKKGAGRKDERERRKFQTIRNIIKTKNIKNIKKILFEKKKKKRGVA
jgi:hypothetical protein